MGGSGGQWPGPLFREETVSEDPLYMHGQRWVQLGLWCWTEVVGAPLARPVPPGPAGTCSDLPLPPLWTQALAVLCGGVLCPRPGRGFVLQPLSLPPLVIEGWEGRRNLQPSVGVWHPLLVPLSMAPMRDPAASCLACCCVLVWRGERCPGDCSLAGASAWGF